MEVSSSRVDVSKKNATEQVICECTGRSDWLMEKLWRSYEGEMEVGGRKKRRNDRRWTDGSCHHWAR